MKVSQYISILFIFISFGLFAQQAPPQGINYQAVALDYEKSEIPGINLESKPLMNETITLRFTIIKDSETGSSAYIETNEVETDENGLFNTVIGQGDIDVNSPQNFQDIDWGTGFHFLKVEIDIKQNGDFKDMGTHQLWSVPYSLYSKKAANGIASISDNGDGTLTFTYLDGSQYMTPVLTGLTGPQGPKGDQGPEGKNAYQIWLDQGNIGDTLTFLVSLKGEKGNGIISTLDNGDGTFTLTYNDGTTFTTSDLRGTNGADGNGITSTTDNGDGTFTFTCTDGSTFTTSDLTGPQGPQGIQGPTGPAGTNGTNGTNGADGNGIASTRDNGDGTFTFTYTDGSTFTTSDLTGPQGPQGIQGPTGPAGSNGTNGSNGTDGNGIASTTDNGDGTFTFTYTDGSTYTTSDLTGPQGPQGIQGPTGPAGTNGANGTNGADGNGITSTSDNGDGTFTFTYTDGSTFTTSDLTGPQGPQGPQGIQGATGPAGSNGTNGTNGADGNGITSTTDNGDGTFTFTYTDGSTFTTSDLTGPQGPQGIQGPTGPAGTNGANGTNGADGNGITSTSDNGDGTFTFTYTDGSTFTTSDLTGPQGLQGIQGPTGATGATGAPGSNGTNGNNGSDGNGIASTTDNGDGTFTFTYTDGNTFTTSNLTGPQGIQGPAGVNGSSSGISFSNIELLYTPGTIVWTVPVGISKVWVKALGGGGGGGTAYNGQPAKGGGGGSGAYCEGFIDVVPGQTISINIGSGGVKSNSQGVDGNDGGDTYFETYLIAGGGKGGKKASTINISGVGGVGGIGSGSSGQLIINGESGDSITSGINSSVVSGGSSPYIFPYLQSSGNGGQGNNPSGSRLAENGQNGLMLIYY